MPGRSRARRVVTWGSAALFVVFLSSWLLTTDKFIFLSHARGEGEQRHALSMIVGFGVIGAARHNWDSQCVEGFSIRPWNDYGFMWFPVGADRDNLYLAGW